jgi:methionine-gamma-lyase
MKEPNVNNAGFATQQIHSDRLVIPGYHPLVTPIFQSSTFIFDDAAQGAARFAGEESGYIYTRVGNPNQTQIAARIATLEHAEACMAFSSVWALYNSMFWTVLQSGDHIVAAIRLRLHLCAVVAATAAAWDKDDICGFQRSCGRKKRHHKKYAFCLLRNPRKSQHESGGH